jgi:hypothetical protein
MLMADLKEREMAIERFVDAGLEALALGVLALAVKALAETLLADESAELVPVPPTGPTVAAQRAVLDLAHGLDSAADEADDTA